MTFDNRWVVLASVLLGLFFQIPLAHADDIPAKVGYNKGFYIKTDDNQFLLKTNVVIQPQYQFLSMEGQDDVSTFQIRRGRLNWSGNVFTEDLTYHVQYEIIGGRASTTREGDPRGAQLLEAYANYKVRDGIEIQVGQFKPYYNREELSSSNKIQFVDRSIINDVFSYGYDIGAAIHGDVLNDKLEYAVFLTNEGNNNNTTNFNNELLMGGRVVYNILGKHGYTMSDVEESTAHQLSVGLAATVNRPSAALDHTILAGATDVAYRYRGLSLLLETDVARDQTSTANIIGVLGQVGYFILPTHLEAVARGASVMVTNDGVTDGYEVGAGLNYFFKGHFVKLQTDYSMLINSPLAYNGAASPAKFVTTGANPGFNQDQVDHRLRTQLQLYF